MVAYICEYTKKKKPTDSYTIKWWLLCYVNFIFKKLFQNFGYLVWHVKSLEDTPPPNKYKSEQTEESTTLLRSIREGKSEDNDASKNWRDQQVNTENHNLLKQQSLREPVLEWGNLNALMNCWRLSVNNSELKTSGRPNHWEAPTLL